MKKNMEDLIIIGGGAAGLAAAVTAKRAAPSMRVTVLEKKINQAESSGPLEMADVISRIQPWRQPHRPLLFLSRWESPRGRTAREGFIPFQKVHRGWQMFLQSI